MARKMHSHLLPQATPGGHWALRGSRLMFVQPLLLEFSVRPVSSIIAATDLSVLRLTKGPAQNLKHKRCCRAHCDGSRNPALPKLLRKKKVGKKKWGFPVCRSQIDDTLNTFNGPMGCALEIKKYPWAPGLIKKKNQGPGGYEKLPLGPLGLAN